MRHMVMLEIDTEDRVSKRDLMAHVIGAVEHWGGSCHPDDPFFPDKIKVMSHGCSRKETRHAE